MGIFRIRRPDDIITVGTGSATKHLVCLEKYESFNPAILGLGDLDTPSRAVEAVATIVDLSGFTTFCRQVDPHLAVPEYLSRFLEWFFNSLKNLLILQKHSEGFQLYADPPFFVKFMGDGLLLLWDAHGKSEVEICNVVGLLLTVCQEYKEKFYPAICRDVVAPPDGLRCGIARGAVFSVGSGDDFVGPCINIAARLQKLSALTFCVSRRGFNFEKHMISTLSQQFIVQGVEIRGIGTGELVYVLKKELESLPADEKKFFEAR